MSAYQDKGRLYTIDDYYGDLNGVFFSVMAFVFGIQTITGYRIYEKGWDPKSTQVLRLYYNKCLPIIESERSDSGKCAAAYRFFVSIMDYLGFRYVGRGSRYNDLIDESLANAVKAMLLDGDHDALRDVLIEFHRK